MKTVLIPIDDHGLKYKALAFICPACKENEGTGLHILSVNSEEKKPSWNWDGFIETPTLEPSILTRGADGFVCHSYLRDGKFEFLSDCTHSMVNMKNVELPDLPDWFIEERKNG
jgi:hypothetical protein